MASLLAYNSIVSAQLDADHYGLDQIKRRLIEFLAVVRLHAIADEATHPTSVVAVDTPAHKLIKASSDRSNPERALVPVSNGSAVSRHVSTPTELPQVSPPRRKKGLKGPILL